LAGESYSSYSFTTSAVDGGEWSASSPGLALPPVKGLPVPTVQEAGWAPEPVWTQRVKEKSLASLTKVKRINILDKSKTNMGRNIILFIKYIIKC
jgi:hypothetical protein